MSLGQTIKELRTRQGLTQAQLGELIGKGESTVRMWELDKAQPTPVTVMKLCLILGTTPSDLLGYEFSPSVNADELERRAAEKGVTVDYLLGRTDDPHTIIAKQNDFDAFSGESPLPVMLYSIERELIKQYRLLLPEQQHRIGKYVNMSVNSDPCHDCLVLFDMLLEKARSIQTLNPEEKKAFYLGMRDGMREYDAIIETLNGGK